jgi:ribose transport system substrate-binding protein
MNPTILRRTLLVGAVAVSLGVMPAFGQEGAESLSVAELGPDHIIGQGPNGEAAASIDDVMLSEEDATKVRAGNFKVALVMHTMNLDWTRLQLQGIKDVFDQYGVTISGTTAADYDVAKQISDIENMILTKPDGIISIPVDNTATAPAYKKVSEAGIKLVFMDNVPEGLQHPADYASMISADSQGNGQIAAEVLASYIPEGGTVGIVNFGIDFFVTNERTKGVKDWLGENRPDIIIKQADFTDPSKVSQVAGDFLTANPDVKGLFVVWDRPALDTMSAMRAQGIDIPVTTIDLGLEAAIEIARGGPLKGLGAQHPYKQGQAEAYAMMQALIGNTPPAWVGVEAMPVIRKNVLEAYKELFRENPPANLVEICKNAGEGACGPVGQ